MEYREIRARIESDYNSVESALAVKGKRGFRTFYINFALALTALHKLVGPFVTTKEQFIEQVKYLEDTESPDVYDNILIYCRDTLKIDIEKGN